MADGRLQRILAQLSGGASTRPGIGRLCEVSADIVAVTGAGVMLMSGETPRGSVCSSNGVSALIEELQYTLGEGPCVDAYHEDQPVLEPDLAAPTVVRWLAFGPPALAAGARAVFGFPLRVGAIRLGALNLYRDHPGGLSDDQHDDALVMAAVAAQAVVAVQALAPLGGLAPDLDAGLESWWVVHQAAGMVGAQLEVSAAEALIRMRAFAFANDQTLTEVAEEVVGHQLRFDEGYVDDEPPGY